MITEEIEEFKNKIICGDNSTILDWLPDNSVDCLITDPPYGYSFMGKDWDKVVPSVKFWTECLRVLKPGAFAFVMSASRQDVLSQMMVRLGQSGFEIGFTSIYWAYASGMPKALNISKAVDKKLGTGSKIVGRIKTPFKVDKTQKRAVALEGSVNGDFAKQTDEDGYRYTEITKPVTPQAKALDGSYAGFQPKPAVEVIIVVMKALSEKNYTEQALENGKGITWLDDVRIPFASEQDKGNPDRFKGVKMLPPEKGWHDNSVVVNTAVGEKGGRFTANLLVSDDVLNDGKQWKGKKSFKQIAGDFHFANPDYKMAKYESQVGLGESGSFSRYFDLDAWANLHLSQFVIQPKASKSEKTKA